MFQNWLMIILLTSATHTTHHTPDTHTYIHTHTHTPPCTSMLSSFKKVQVYYIFFEIFPLIECYYLSQRKVFDGDRTQITCNSDSIIRDSKDFFFIIYNFIEPKPSLYAR